MRWTGIVALAGLTAIAPWVVVHLPRFSFAMISNLGNSRAAQSDIVGRGLDALSWTPRGHGLGASALHCTIAAAVAALCALAIVLRA